MPRSGIGGSHGSSIFSFLSNVHMFSIVTVPIYIPTKSVGEVPFIHNLSSMLYIFLMVAILTDVRHYFIAFVICIL